MCLNKFMLLADLLDDVRSAHNAKAAKTDSEIEDELTHSQISNVKLQDILPIYPALDELNSSEVVGNLYDLESHLASYRIFCRFSPETSTLEKYQLLTEQVLEMSIVLIEGSADLIINCDAFSKNTKTETGNLAPQSNYDSTQH